MSIDFKRLLWEDGINTPRLIQKVFDWSGQLVWWLLLIVAFGSAFGTDLASVILSIYIMFYMARLVLGSLNFSAWFIDSDHMTYQPWLIRLIWRKSVQVIEVPLNDLDFHEQR